MISPHLPQANCFVAQLHKTGSFLLQVLTSLVVKLRELFVIFKQRLIERLHQHFVLRCQTLQFLRGILSERLGAVRPQVLVRGPNLACMRQVLGQLYCARQPKYHRETTIAYARQTPHMRDKHRICTLCATTYSRYHLNATPLLHIIMSSLFSC